MTLARRLARAAALVVLDEDDGDASAVAVLLVGFAADTDTAERLTREAIA